MFNDIAKGDSQAVEFMCSLHRFFHMEDDLVDRDREVPAQEVVTSNLWLMFAFSHNEFFQRHKTFLWPTLVTSALAWQASEEFKKREDICDKIASQVLKSEYLNVYLGVAYCLGGFEHAEAMSRKYRRYHFDEK